MFNFNLSNDIVYSLLYRDISIDFKSRLSVVINIIAKCIKLFET